MKRVIRSHPAVAEPVSTDNIRDIKNWLQSHAVTYSLRWLLAHADDGVIWGRVDDGELITSDRVASGVSPTLRLKTLQSARLFAPPVELLLWRDGQNVWHARVIRDTRDDERATWKEAIDEPQILWGTDPEPLDSGFTLMSDGVQGLHHVVPIEVRSKYNEQSRPLRLWVRHYIREDKNGFTRVVASRILALCVEETK